ncbi:hypothetical protein AAZX31_10G071000 [Glycine max]|uniref:TF-B3 domain-containing protein n=2 Tax=Glycine subgen. Soja TaxID=1462606 RepID=K7LHY6_SOYBN|nr:B3 domain-containing protein At2g36080 [Glycine max]XP_028183584.1 B3 domain-containing protein At2g36080-like [Glycine soja]KAG5003208.1 hypothetical protein JHK86_027347 [Glycine max]KAG5126383.1 hypothetical protein JHK82_027218 [Glycine max]KAG5150987.1 hypothetical protein JHK84_027459 [Glycine max]KAH1137235.1 hypothetical protein GYH30_027282 [Glycine max]KAH1227991.1 B3 domain-containing protein [Glycine max]|eukprot:XP_003537081.1 B3 domain-containing protein At2g36080 [Glycine max]
MSINHYSMDLPEPTLWWPHPHHQQQQLTLMDPDPLRLNLNSDDGNGNDNDNDENQTTTTGGEQEILDDKEPMFEKPLTPSDVGKLNRLVIPKQHAEKYFPLSGDSGGSECKGLLLSFEDESGKCWRFRYSYWNSSQSYVLTKGWSRYVKDKRLDAGDVVLFERHRVDAQRLFIGWRRRRQSDAALPPAHVSSRKSGGGDGNSNKNEGWTRGFYSAHHPYPTHHLHHHQPSPYQQQHDCLHAGRGSQGQNQRMRPVGNNSSSSSSSSRVLRLFGVDMECQPEHDDSGPSTPQCSYNSNNMLPSTQGTDHSHHNFYQQQPSNSNPSPHHMMVHHQPYYY